MRVVLALLLLANAALFMWATWHKGEAPSVAVLAPRPPVAPEKLKLLTEPGVRLVPRVEVPAVPATDEVTEQLYAVRGCYRAGPFTTSEAAAAAATITFVPRGIASSVTAETRTVTTYRVVLGPLKSKAAAERKRRELTRAGIRDHALIKEGDVENVIALGIFTVEANARNRMRQLAAKRVPAVLKPVTTTRRSHWLVLTQPAYDGRIAGVAITDITQTNLGDGATLSSRPCRAAPDKAATR